MRVFACVKKSLVLIFGRFAFSSFKLSLSSFKLSLLFVVLKVRVSNSPSVVRPGSAWGGCGLVGVGVSGVGWAGGLLRVVWLGLAIC